MEGEWQTLHRIEEVSNLISLLRGCETYAITRNAMRFILKIPIFSVVYLPS